MADCGHGWHNRSDCDICMTPSDYDDLRQQLWLLLHDVKARAVSCSCHPPLTKHERYHIERAEALLADYEPENI